MGLRWGASGSWAGGLAALLLGCGPAGEFGPDPELQAPPVLLQQVLFEGYTGGARDVQIHGARARIEPTERIAHLERVRIEFRDTERGAVEIRAESARIDLREDDFVLLGQVEGSMAAGEEFQTSEVRYDASARRLWTDRPVRVRRRNLTLEGDGMEIDVDRRRIRITGGVRTTVGPG